MARPAFDQEVTYDLREGSMIGFKGARVEILEATNMNVRLPRARALPTLTIGRPAVTKSFRLTAGSPILLCLAVTASAQLVVKEGRPQQIVDYMSPMVLGFPAPSLLRAAGLPPGARITEKVPDLSAQVCESALIRRLVMVASGPNKKGLIAVDLTTILEVKPGSDKLVTLQFGIVVGDQLIASAILKNLDAEEGKSMTRKVQLQVPVAKLPPPESPPVMRITMTVRANG